jgi:hypothetical protein
MPFIYLWKYDSTAYPMMEAVLMYYNPGDWC